MHSGAPMKSPVAKETNNPPFCAGGYYCYDRLCELPLVLLPLGGSNKGVRYSLPSF